MVSSDDIRWLNAEFGAAMSNAISGTSLTVEFLAALACQESGEVWPSLRRQALAADDILALCVGDTFDASGGRKAFPLNKADLVAKPQGQAMFDLARQALVDVGKYIPAYGAVTVHPEKFCHAFGMFQRDIQFFLGEPNFFLQGTYKTFDGSLNQVMVELRAALATLKLDSSASLTDQQLISVGIVYNAGHYDPALGMRQGFKSNDGTFYGEALYRYLLLARNALASATPQTPPAK
jgi:hypothetical protein